MHSLHAMNKRVVAAIAGGVGLSVLLASAAALSYAVNPRVELVDVTTSRSARILCEPRLRGPADEVVASSVLILPTVTIVGDVTTPSR